MTYLTALFAWIITKDNPGTTTQKMDDFLNQWVNLEWGSMWFFIALGLVVLAIAIAIFLLTRDSLDAEWAMYLGCVGLIFLLVLPIGEIITYWLVSNMANAYSPTLGITDQFTFIGSLIFIALLGAG